MAASFCASTATSSSEKPHRGGEEAFALNGFALVAEIELLQARLAGRPFDQADQTAFQRWEGRVGVAEEKVVHRVTGSPGGAPPPREDLTGNDAMYHRHRYDTLTKLR